MGIQGVGNHAILAQLQGSYSAQHTAQASSPTGDHDGDKDYGAIDSNDGSTKGQHINVTA